MCKDDFAFYISNCCGAGATYPGFPDSDLCSVCYEHAEFNDKDTDRIIEKHKETDDE